MVHLLRKFFIKDYENVNEKKVRDAHGKLASFVGVFSNLFLFAIKLVAGLLSGSISILSDSINNLSDMGSSIVTLIGFRMSSVPADKEHPFGHERMEYIASLIVSVIILFVGFTLGYNSILKVIHYEKIKIDYIIIIILGVSIVIKTWQSYFNKKIGKIINSITLEATAADSRNDVITTCVILIGSIVVMLFPNIPFSVDGVLGIFVSIFILISGIGLVKNSMNPLLGVAGNPEFINRIITDIKKYPHVLGIHDPICHMYGAKKCFMTCHVEVPYDGDLCEIHDIIDNIERELGEKYGCLLTIHMDPIDNKSENVLRLKHLLIEALCQLHPEFSLHDFRVVEGPTHTNLIFDVVLPQDFKENQGFVTEALYQSLEHEQIQYYLIIEFDKSYLMVSE